MNGGVAQADAPWGKLKEEYNIQRKYPPRRLVSLKVRVNGTPSISQRNKVIETLVPGDILIFKRPKLYDHYAVYIGNGNVININAKSCGGGAGMFLLFVFFFFLIGHYNVVMSMGGDSIHT